MFEAISQYLADTPHLQSLRKHPVPSSSRRRKKLHTSRTPTPDAFRWGRHHLGIRGRIASEFALVRALAVETHENWMEANRYINMDDLREHKKLALRQAA
ncbi:hypothetical protein GOL30_24980 [Sinorhizobium medicae]|nr:hypothetical protein [Sinorhizobium medicae]MDX0482228.1 hypothetical protein [Sinorhizobium medicae]MDX0685435.1 hypothetical protein [Sinorhizobium medicae]MDX0838901.1 hypothetical protein [Sinorhizobium medicae]MDX0900808.1 hypothetical protein [Sinorhizobium medicae]